MIKNATPNQIALFAALFTSVIIVVVLLLSDLLGLIHLKWHQFFFIWLLNFGIGYLIIINALRRYIYRKIKLIYKSIHSSKRSSPRSSQEEDMNKDIIGEVEQEVAEWADSQKKQIESLKSLEAYRRNFLGNISHELKTPLFSIQGYLHTLLEGGLYDERINESYLRKAVNNVDRLSTIIEDLESISQLESGELILDIQNFDIRTLTLEVIEELEFFAQEKEIQLSLKDGANSSFFVKADRENIRQVLVNLITNSIKYGKVKGQTKLAFYDMESYILVEVADNGIGISEKHLKHVFDRFYRVDKSRSRSQGGSGLGLSIVKHIIEAHKQTINVRSSKELGSTFGFTLEKA